MAAVQAAALAPLRRRDFRLFWAGQWISRLGDNIHLVAQAWLVWSLTGSGAAMATITLCSTIPSVAMLLVGGTLVDRLPRRWISIWSDLLRAGLLLVAGGLYFTGLLQVWHLYLLAAAFGLVSAFARPAFRALIQTLVQPDELVATNGLISGGQAVAGIAGPAIGGLVMGAGGAGLAFILNGASFLAAAVALLFTNPAEPALTSDRQPLRLKVLWEDLVEAVGLLAQKPFLLGTIGVMSLIVVTGQAPVVLLRPWVAERAGGGVETLSLAYSAFAAGMFVMVALLTGVRLRRGREWCIYAGLTAAGLTQVGMAMVSAPWQMWTLDFLLGASVMIYGVIWPALLQERVQPQAMGRVAAIDQFGVSLLYPAGVALIGALLAGPGPYWVMLVGGWLSTGVALVGGVFLTYSALRVKT
ncbi:MAG: MFS transporter [Bacillota bacterium]